MLVTNSGGLSISATIPDALAAELWDTPKRQRNTQAELLAVLMLMLTLPEQLRGRHLVLYEDNQGALHNMLAGSAADPQSRDLSAAIWLVAAVLRVTIWIEYIPSESNPSDCFSRPAEEDKQREMRELTAEFGLQAAAPVLPATLRMEPEAWSAAIEAAQKPAAANERDA